jgi:GTP-binding protein
LLNYLSDKPRAIVSEIAGTTRDPVDELIEIGGEQYLFIDTAGIKRRSGREVGADFYSVLRTNVALENAEVALALIDASEEIAEQDVRVVNQVVDQGRALVILMNKWDLMDDDRRMYLERVFASDFAHVSWAERVNISAKTGRRVDKLIPAIHSALENWGKRISTGKLNAFLGDLQAAHPHPLRGGKQSRILFATQASTKPPHFVIFATGFIEAGYRRFIERKLRETFGFEGTPINISVRIREKRSRR